ncbi:tyrosine-type recombinase/integrase [Halorubellus sp. JP-L1]|uniref:tyrosine-type recombinase/integrase n=1 Tax=Halorubellus sp. JP-L1 TaxID=2715753 RepID=UPI00140739B9|nr:tyrosine-type recombinase/integrase [Halorubellus sp. JP-L1]NHN43151.1 tyrosine-type recombinase/integrase [Halorubellus sp. JP-L1]
MVDGTTSLEAAVEARLRRLESGNYRRNNELVLEAFVDFQRSRGIDRLADLDATDCRRYAQHLADRVRDGEVAASTANTYYDVVRAWLGWCVRDGRIAENPADTLRATEDLPTDAGDADRQYWWPEEREAMFAALDALVDGANDEAKNAPGDAAFRTAGDRSGATWDQLKAHRDRALFYTLGLSGARGAEILRDPDDDRRNGITWADVDFDASVVRVFGKTREHQTMQVMTPALERLERFRRLLDPPSEDWPVFVSLHRPSLYRVVRETLADCGWPEDRIESRLDADGPLALARAEDVTPRAISLQGARSMMQRRCEAADVSVDGEYLKPHGGRRGLGHELYSEKAELAQEVLRHESVTTTHDSYREVQAERLREDAEDVLYGDE